VLHSDVCIYMYVEEGYLSQDAGFLLIGIGEAIIITPNSRLKCVLNKTGLHEKSHCVLKIHTGSKK
jgi:hypothetical protein